MASILQTVDTYHEDVIHDAQVDYFGTTMATASSDETIRIFDLQHKQSTLMAELKGHEGPVWGLSWSHPMYGNLLASCGYDRQVIVWREVDGMWKQAHVHAEHKSSVNCVAWGPHECGLLFACGSSDGSISVVSARGDDTWAVIKINDAHAVGVNALSWAPVVDIDAMFNPSNGHLSPTETITKHLVSGGCDNIVKIWRQDPVSALAEYSQNIPQSVNSARGKWVLEACLQNEHTDWIRDVAWSSQLISNRQQIATCGQDGKLIVWQQHKASRQNSTNHKLNHGSKHKEVKHQLDDVPMSRSSTADHGASTGDEKDVLESNSKSWKPVLLETYEDVVWTVSWSVTGNILAASVGGENKVNLWKESLEGVWQPLLELNRGKAKYQTNESDDENQDGDDESDVDDETQESSEEEGDGEEENEGEKDTADAIIGQNELTSSGAFYQPGVPAAHVTAGFMPPATMQQQGFQYGESVHENLEYQKAAMLGSTTAPLPPQSTGASQYYHDSSQQLMYAPSIQPQQETAYAPSSQSATSYNGGVQASNQQSASPAYSIYTGGSNLYGASGMSGGGAAYPENAPVSSAGGYSSQDLQYYAQYYAQQQLQQHQQLQNQGDMSAVPLSFAQHPQMTSTSGSGMNNSSGTMMYGRAGGEENTHVQHTKKD